VLKLPSDSGHQRHLVHFGCKMLPMTAVLMRVHEIIITKW